MSLTIPQFYPDTFSRVWESKLQQTDSRLASAVTMTELPGKRKSFNKLNKGSMTEITTRKGNTPDGDTEGEKYWLYSKGYEFVRSWGEFDQAHLDGIVLPTSDEVAEFTNAENRTKDQTIISAFDATRQTGEEGTDAEAWDTAYDVAVDYVASGSTANSGLTLAKVLKAKQLMDAAEVPDGERYFACSAQQVMDMLLQTNITSGDYNRVKPLVDGTVDMLAGFKFIRTELLSRASGTGIRTCFAWHKSGIKFGTANRAVHMDILPSKRHRMQLRGVVRMGAVRTEPGRVVRVYADEVL